MLPYTRDFGTRLLNDTVTVTFRVVRVMRSWIERYTEARRHVATGRSIIERQRALIERDQASGADTKSSEELLARFEASQMIFEEDLLRIRREAK
jgi:hypothetical protein